MNLRAATPPESCRPSIPYARAWNIGIRTVHIAAMSVLVGAHAFDVPAPRLHVTLGVTIASGAVLILLEAFSVTYRWLYQGRGLMVLAKLALLAVVPFAWGSRLPILLIVIVLASVGSHMPARFRYYSVVDRRIL
ncbi:MAG: hypothetical protein ACM3NQ_22485 [Bacteroidales bacterium]